MKQKLIVTLIASALELYAATALAQTQPSPGSCFLAGTSKSANASTPVAAGPLNPVDGFPEYVTDSTGLTVQRCLDPNVCFFDPIIESDPFSLQIGSGGEAFYWGADATLADVTGKVVFKLVMAAETAFLQAGPNGEPINGSQLPFLRLRYVFDAPADGVYTLSHPYGQEEFTVTGATGNRDIFTTYDRGLTANSSITGNVGPFMTSLTTPPGGFLGDAGPTAVTDLASGAPCFVNEAGFNTVTLTGVDAFGNPIDFGGGQTILTTDQFAVQGKIYDGRVQTPVGTQRVTYSRSAAGAGQIEAFVGSTAAATATVMDGPTIVPGTGRIANPVALDHTVVLPDGTQTPEGINSTAVGVADASALPAVVQLTVSDASVNATTGAAQFDPTTENLRLVDFLDVTQAEFDPATNTLTVSAQSGDKRSNPTLTVRGFGTIDPATSLFTLNTLAPPSHVDVDSAAGGTARAQVRVVTAVAPAAPTSVAATLETARTLTLNWTDNASNETGFRIYTVNTTTGARTQVATAGVNASSVKVSGLAPATTYTFQVEAFNGAGAASSETLVASTLALPAPATSPNFAFSDSVQRRLDISWTASADATSYRVERSVNNGAFTALATVNAPATSHADLNGAASTTYVYRVVALRTINGEVDESPVATTPSKVSVGNPLSTSTPTATVSGQNVTVSFTDRSTNEANFQVYRRLGTGAYAAVSGLIASDTVSTTNNVKSFADNNLAFGTYNYRVDVSNWATTVQSGISLNVNVANLLAPTNLTADTNARPTITWTDNAVGESGYRLLRNTLTVAANGSVTESTQQATLTALANATTFREANQLANASYRYRVLAVNGATTGAEGIVQTVVGGLPQVGNPTLTRSLVGTAARVTVTWTRQNQAAVGGYEIQRCEGAGCTNFTKLAGSAVNTDGTVDGRGATGTLSFQDNTVNRGTVYRYRIRAVGGGKPSALGAFNATAQTITTQ